MLAMLAMLALAAGQVEPESELDCYDGPFENVLLDGCVDDCQSFESLADAEAHCNSIVECGGITKTAYGDQEAVSLGVGLYEVRAGPGIETAQGDHTWIKQVDCASGTQGDGEEAALSDLDRMVQNGQLTPEGDGEEEGQYTEGDICRTYAAPIQGKYLEGCVDECRSYETLQEAEDHCDRVADCGGVTHSLYGEGQAWHDGVGPYEVRRGPALKASEDGDMTWIRVEHACDDDTQGGLGAWEGSFSSSVDEAETSLVSTVSWMVVMGMLVGGAVLFSYKKGHPATVTYVDRAHDEIKRAMGRSGVQIPGGGGGYESL